MIEIIGNLKSGVSGVHDKTFPVELSQFLTVLQRDSEVLMKDDALSISQFRMLCIDCCL